MQSDSKEAIRQKVRDTYGKIAKKDDSFKMAGGCCGSTPEKELDQESPGCCGAADITTQQLSHLMGYSQADLDSVPDGANMELGCGNPVAIGELKPGETVVDLGSGGGFDCFLAAKKVGPAGSVIGVDMTPDMVSKARANAAKVNADNVEFRLGEIEHLPLADNQADVILSNCVVNLSPDKSAVYQDAYRVLKPGGRLAISDIVAVKKLPDDVQKNLAAVAACIGGAATIDETKAMLSEAGFSDIKVTPKKISPDLINQWLPGSNVADFVVSAYIEAYKPK